MTTSKSSYHSAIDVWMFDPLLDKWYTAFSLSSLFSQFFVVVILKVNSCDHEPFRSVVAEWDRVLSLGSYVLK